MSLELFDKQRVHVNVRSTVPSVNISRHGRIVFSKDCVAILDGHVQIYFDREARLLRFARCSKISPNAFTVYQTKNSRSSQSYINGRSVFSFLKLAAQKYPAIIGQDYIDIKWTCTETEGK